MMSSPQPPPLEVYMLGLVDFDDAQQLQRRLVYDLGERGGAALILCEHPPTISVGRSGSRAPHRRPTTTSSGPSASGSAGSTAEAAASSTSLANSRRISPCRSTGWA